MKMAIIVLLLTVLTACGLTHVSPNAALQEGDLAKVYFYSKGTGTGVELSNMRVDNVRKGFFDLGLAVTPGTHDISVDFMLVEEECSPAREYCYDLHTYGSCKGTLRAQPGRTYAVRIAGISGAAFFTVEDEESKETAGSGSCRS